MKIEVNYSAAFKIPYFEKPGRQVIHIANLFLFTTVYVVFKQRQPVLRFAFFKAMNLVSCVYLRYLATDATQQLAPILWISLRRLQNHTKRFEVVYQQGFSILAKQLLIIHSSILLQ